MPHPPQLPFRLLKVFCRRDLFPFLEGDLVEFYARNVKQFGPAKANRLLYKEIFYLFRPGILKNIPQATQLLGGGMPRNYLKVSWRNLVQERKYSLINLAGLSMGLCCFLIIYLFVDHERSYDRFYDDVEDIYLVYEHAPGDTYMGSDLYAVTPAQLASTLVANYPEIQQATTIKNASLLLGTDKTGYLLEQGLWVDTSFFRVFSHPAFLQGEAVTAMSHPKSIVLTLSLASKLGNPYTQLGNFITVKGEPYLISGIVEDPPSHSTFQFDYLINLQSHPGYLSEFEKERWDGSNYQTYFKARPEARVEVLQRKMAYLIKTHWIEDRTALSYHFLPMTDMHMRADLNNDFDNKGNPQQLAIFQGIAFLILALACFNYVNLSIARSMHRAREVGLRKTIGARRPQLIFQFLLEATLLAVVAMGVALVTTYLALPEFGRLLNRELSLLQYLNFKFLLIILAGALGLGILAGSYPAFILSAISTLKTLKSTSTRVRASSGQQAIIIGQYALSMIMVIGTIIMYQQFQFINQQEMGFAQDQIVTLEVKDPEIRKHYEVIKNEWLKHPNVVQVGTSQNLPHEVRSATIINDDTGGDPTDDLPIYRLRADADFLKVYDLQLVAGRMLPQVPTEGMGYCLINETAAEALGYTPELAIGQTLTDDSPRNYRTVIGVVKDFHLHSLHLAISPVLIETKTYFQYISVQLDSEKQTEAYQHLTSTLEAYTNYPVEFQYMDQRLDALYYADRQEANLFSTFSIWAVFIASIGL
ncbi:MAG: ABC transporter permease, partial [Bacteroidota bacterium]